MPYTRQAIGGLVAAVVVLVLGWFMLNTEVNEALGAIFLGAGTSALIVVAALGGRTQSPKS